MPKVIALPAAEGFTFGCDPELFILDEKKRPVPAVGLIPGTKNEPHKVKCGAVQVDGLAAEFNTDPASSFEEFDKNISTVMEELEKFLPKGYSFSLAPAVEFPAEVFDKAPDEAKVLGCDPDFNAWTGEVNTPPDTSAIPYLRTASGHIHVGWKGDIDMSSIQHTLNCQDLVKQLDWFLGAWSIMIDKDNRRRLLYGKAGAYRPKPYGVEYRVLSNFWIFSTEHRIEVWNRLQKAIGDMTNRFYPDIVARIFSSKVQTSINSSSLDRTLAGEFRYPIKSIGSMDDSAKPHMRGKLRGGPPDPFIQVMAAQQWNAFNDAGGNGNG